MTITGSVAYGSIPENVMKKASSKGYPNWVIVFVPDPNESYIY